MDTYIYIYNIDIDMYKMNIHSVLSQSSKICLIYMIYTYSFLFYFIIKGKDSALFFSEEKNKNRLNVNHFTFKLVTHLQLLIPFEAVALHK